jgi:hypothetical protein
LFELEETRCQLVTCDVGEFGENQKHKLIPSQFKSGLLLEDFTFYHKGPVWISFITGNSYIP